jgi:Membrane domain of glycerophosphoryl diester phosphodiesterase
MESNLRPFTLGEILDRTAQLYRSNFLVFAGIFSIYAGVALILNLAQIGLGVLLHHDQASARFSWPLVATVVIEYVILVLLLGAAVAAINRAVAWVHLGEPATIRTAYSSTLPRFGRYMWLVTITGVIAWLPLALLYGAFFLYLFLYIRPKGILSHPNGGADPQALLVFGLVSILFGVLALAAFIYGLLMSLRYALALPACVVEEITARRAIKRSIALSKGARGRIFVLFLLVGVIKLGLVSVTQSFFLILVFKNHGQVAPWVSAISQVVAFFTNTFIGPIGATGIAVFYYDQRVRKEGYDIERMMAAAGLTVPALEAADSQSTPSASADWPAHESPHSNHSTAPEAAGAATPETSSEGREQP